VSEHHSSLGAAFAANSQRISGLKSGEGYLQPVIQWTPIVTNAADTNGAWQFTDSQTENFSQRFYRVLAQ
jgi:hypothetical protein